MAINLPGVRLIEKYQPGSRILSVLNALSFIGKEQGKINQKSVLLVCTANICRSPMAEGILQHKLISKGLADRIKVGSAGVSVHDVGHEADPRAQKISSDRGVDLSRSRARQIKLKDFSRYDYILAMGQDNFKVLGKMCPEQYRHKLAMAIEFVPESGVDEVPDPYYSSVAGFEVVFDLLEIAMDNFICHIYEDAG